MMGADESSVQSPGRVWRNKRIVGYQGESVRSSSHTQIGVEGEQCPDGFAHRAGEVGDGSVGGDDQVEIGDQRGRVGVIGKVGGVVDQLQDRAAEFRGAAG